MDESFIISLLKYLQKLEGPDEDNISVNSENRDQFGISKSIKIKFIDDGKNEKYKLYFAYSNSTSPTLFESESNLLKIAVRSKKDVVGRWLLLFLKMIYDDLGDKWIKENSCNFEKMKINIYDPHINSYYTNKFWLPGQEIVVRRYIANIDVWDINRIMSEFGVN